MIWNSKGFHKNFKGHGTECLCYWYLQWNPGTSIFFGKHNWITKKKKKTKHSQTASNYCKTGAESLAVQQSATQFITIIVVIVSAFRENPKQDWVLYYLSVISAGKYITTWQSAMPKQTALHKSEKW